MLRNLFEKSLAVLKKPVKIIYYFERKGLFNFISDRLYIRIFYRLKVGEKLNIENPVTFNEKLQWLKLYNRRPEYTQLVDKYSVREYISDQIGEQYLIPLVGVYDTFEEINFDKLPGQFVIKSTHDSGGVVICENKKNFNISRARKKINRSLNRNYYYHGREWPYKNINKKVIVEKFLEDEATTVPNDYKLWVFNGVVQYINVHYEKDSKVHINVYDTEWNLQDFTLGENSEENDFTTVHDQPKNLSKMIKFAEKLGKDEQFVRIDFYEVNGQLYFGEITFYPTSGYIKFHPNQFELDKMYGDMLNLRLESPN